MFISFFSFSSLFLSLFIIFYSPEFSWELFLYLLKTRERRCLKDIAPGPNILLSFTSFKEGPGEYWWTHFHTSQSWFLSLIFISYFLSSGKVMRVHESYFYMFKRGLRISLGPTFISLPISWGPKGFCLLTFGFFSFHFSWIQKL